MDIENYVMQVDSSIKNFRFNVSIALFYEVFKLLKDGLEKNIKKKLLSDSFVKITKLMIPFTPHLANECLEKLGCIDNDLWPKFSKENMIKNIELPIQINGKTRDVIEVKINSNEEEIKNILTKRQKIKKYIDGVKIVKTIFVKNKIINYIIKK